ncbi:MAG: PaaI family thioesterase [Acidimicrobiales bacterium]|jgi:acyl-coenzyme A thioesterase PaaI-like protein
MPDDPASPADGPASRAWDGRAPGRLIGKGHPAGDFLQAYDWEVLEEREGYLRIEVELPMHVRNPRGQLFGGFTPTYVDMIALFTVRAGQLRQPGARRTWLATTNMRIDYFDPIVGPRFVIESTLERRRGRTAFVATRFFQDGELAVHALTTMREMPRDRPLGDA